MSATEQSPEARELALIDKVELRIALADTDTKLQNTLKTYLAPLLLKLASEHASVRNKVIGICRSINQRIQPDNIQLPVLALVKQFKDNAKNPLIAHFDLLFCQKGLGRLPTQERADLFPVLCSNISATLSAATGQIGNTLNLMFRSLICYKLPQRESKQDLELRSSLELTEADTKYLSLWFSKLLLLRSGFAGNAESRACPGVSQDEFDVLTLQNKPEVWNPSAPGGLSLTDTKHAVLKTLLSGLFTNEERLFPAVFAASDANSRVSDLGEELMKQAIADVSLDDGSLVERLFNIYFGGNVPSPLGQSLVPQVRVPVQVRILNLLSRTPESTKFSERIIKVAQQGLLPNAAGDIPSESGIKIDREGLKLRSSIVSFLTFVSRKAAPHDLEPIGQKVIEALKYFLDQQYSDSGSMEMKAIRGRCFEVVGLLGSSCSGLLKEPNLSLLHWLFRSLADEKDKDVVFSIDEALSASIRPLQSGVSTEVREAMKLLLMNNLDEETRNLRNLRFATIRFANRCLDFDDVTARWIDLVTLGTAEGDSHELIEEAKKGLDPYWHQLLRSSTYESTTDLSGSTQKSKLKLPPFADQVNQIFDKHSQALSKYPALLALSVSYCKKMLYLEALDKASVAVDINPEWERKLELAILEDLTARSAVRSHISTLASSSESSISLQYLWQAAIQGLSTGTPQNRKECMSLIEDFCTLGSPDLLNEMSKHTAKVEPLVYANDIQLRSPACHCVGLLLSLPTASVEMVSKYISTFMDKVSGWETASGPSANGVHGASLATAYLITRRHYNDPDDSLSDSTVNTFASVIFNMLNNASERLLQDAAYESLGQLCLYQLMKKPLIAKHVSLRELVDKITRKARDGNERAIACLGHLSLSLDESSDSESLNYIIDQIRSLHEIRQPDTQFAVGEALCCVASGWESTHLSSKFDMDGKPPVGSGRGEAMTAVVDKVLNDNSNSKPALKKASVIWLLCILQFCGGRPEVQSRLVKFQNSFKRCLSDRDELVQESASRGLGLVYERGDRALKDDLVRDLVNSFSGNKTNISGTITEDTQLFDEGELPTGDGSITTYKDIMNLASEVGDSSLVYRFMSLASNNAIWSSRAAFGRFGLSNVLSDSSVDGYLAQNPKLYPKLYRYRFDANSNVRRSMNDIWNSLVKDSSATIEAHFDEIIEDLFVSILGREWRGRQASCTALSDLLQGRKLEKVLPFLERCWTVCYKVLDDIKESVRVAAAELARTLTNILIRSLEAGEGKAKASGDMLGKVLPFLLSTSGLESSAEDVRSFALHTLLQIIKKSNAAVLRPFVPDLVDRLLAMLSTFEPEAVNYLHLNASKYNMKQQDIDEARLKSVRSSPLMEAIERCLDHLDDDTMAKLVPALQGAIKSAVGVPTKVGCSRVLVSLSTRRNFVFRPYSSQFLAAVRKRVLDRNSTVTSSYASAIGYLARGAEDEDIIATIAFSKKLYLESENDQERLASGDIVSAIGKNATDRFNSLASEILPFIFMARHDSDKDVREVYQETWEENVGGARAASLYLREIMKQASEHSDSKRWSVKHAAALSIADAITSVIKANGAMSEAEGDLVWPPLKTAMAEKTWDGKETVLEAFASFTEKSRQFRTSRKAVEDDIKKISLREARRRNLDYQVHALKALGRVAAARAEDDMFDDVTAICEPVLGEAKEDGGDKMEVDGEEAQERLLPLRLAAALDALSNAAIATTGPSPERALRVLDLAASIPSPRKPHLDAALFASAQKLFKGPKALAVSDPGPSNSPLSLHDPALSRSVQSRFAQLIVSSNDSLESQRSQRAGAIRSLCHALGASEVTFQPELSDAIADLSSREKSPAIRSTLLEAQRHVIGPH